MITVIFVQDFQHAARLRSNIVTIRSRLRKELAEMSSSFEDVARRTRVSTITLPAVEEAASADELISTLKALYSGVCNMVLQCQHDLSDDWGGEIEIYNSRAGQDRCRIETERQLGSAERRCKLVEEQVSNLKELFQVQWDLSQQVNVDITQLREEIVVQKREVEKSWFETSQLFEEVQNVRLERNALQKQVSSCLLSFIL